MDNPLGREGGRCETEGESSRKPSSGIAVCAVVQEEARRRVGRPVKECRS